MRLVFLSHGSIDTAAIGSVATVFNHLIASWQEWSASLSRQWRRHRRSVVTTTAQMTATLVGVAVICWSD